MPAQDFSLADYALLGSALAATYADTELTKQGLKKTGREEANILVGKNPSGSDIDKAAITAGLLGSGVASLLPKKLRRPFLGGWTGLEAGLANEWADIIRHGNTPKRETLPEILTDPIVMALTGAGLASLLPDNNAKITVLPAKEGKGLSLAFQKNF